MFGHEKYPEGEKHAFLASIQSNSREEAVAMIIAEMNEAAWFNVEIEETGIKPRTSKTSEDEENSENNGIEITIYKDIEP